MSTLKVNTISPESGTSISVTGDIAYSNANTKYLSNPNNLTTSVSIDYGSTHNFAVIGPVTVEGASVTSTVTGGTVKII